MKTLSYKVRPRRTWSGGPRRGAGCEEPSLLSLAARGDVHVGGTRDMELRQQRTGTKVQSAMSEARLEIRRTLQIPPKAGFHSLSQCKNILTQFLQGLEDMALREQSSALVMQQIPSHPRVRDSSCACSPITVV